MSKETPSTTAWGADPYALAYPELKPFWEAAEAGRLSLPLCQDCGKSYWYPRPICPLCGSARTRWIEASGNGTLFAFSEMRKAEKPYILAYVTLAEGPRLMTSMIGCDAASLSIGMPVTMKMVAADEGRRVPMFTPA